MYQAPNSSVQVYNYSTSYWISSSGYHNPVTFTAQNGFAFIETTLIDATTLPTFMFVKGANIPTDYVPYYKTIPQLKINVADILGSNAVPIENFFAQIVKASSLMHIKLLGDSITAGVGGTGFDDSSTGGGEQIYGSVYQNIAGHCWANTLKTFWEEKFNVSVVNNGWSGSDSHHIIQYWNYLVDANDDVLVCTIGTNDREACTDLDEFIGKLEQIVSLANTNNKKLVMIADIPASVTNENLSTMHFHMEDVEHAVRYVTDKYNIPFMNLYKLFMDYCKFTNVTIDSLLADGLHPNDNGYDVMFYLISNAFGIDTKRPDANW
jgi:lysophospholipase L1-like esterase